MPEKCVHMTSGICTTCQALDQALAELQRVRGQRDRLAGVLRIVMDTAMSQERLSMSPADAAALLVIGETAQAALAGIAARP
jgi:hypothetical protein